MKLPTLRTAEHGGKEVSNEVNERPIHSGECTALCALSANGIIDPL